MVNIMQLRAFLSLRDRLIGAAALAYAVGLILEAAGFALSLLPVPDWVDESWGTAGIIILVCATLGQGVGFSVAGAGFLRERLLRDRRLRIGAHLVGSSYLLSFVGLVVFYSAASDVGDNGVNSMLACLAGATAALLVARAFREGSTGASPELSDRGWPLAWAALWFAVNAGLLAVSHTAGSWTVASSALYAASEWVTVVAAAIASFAFFRAACPDMGKVLGRAIGVRTLLALVAGVLFIAGVLLFAYGVVAFKPFQTHGQGPSAEAWAWLNVLGNLRLVVAGALVSLAFVVSGQKGDGPRAWRRRWKWAMETGESGATCPSCGAAFNPSDYREDAPDWLCDRCGESLRSSVQ